MQSYLTVLTNSLILSLAILASSAASEELKGKVTAAKGTSVELATDSEFLPIVGDKVEIFIELKAIKSTAIVTTGTVTSVNGATVVVQIDNPKATVLVGQLARIDSPKPMKKGDAPMLPQPDAPAVTSPTVTFDELSVGSQPGNALARYGITAISTKENRPLVYAASESQVPPSGRKNLLSAGTVSTRMSTLTLTFARPLRRFDIVRIGVIRGGSLPKWRMEALDGAGNVIATTGEADWGFDPKPKRFSVAGRGISSVRIEADNRWGNGTFATYNAVPIAELYLEEDSPTPSAPPLGPAQPGHSDSSASGGREDVLFSDSFDRSDANGVNLGEADLALGGSGRHVYLPMWPSGGTSNEPAGAKIAGNALVNIGRDFGGVQFAAPAAARGVNIGQDIHIRVDLLVPTDEAGRITQAGPYFRSRAAASGDGLIGGTSAGYWVQLHSTGQVKVKRLNPAATVAVSETPPQFDSAIFHTLEIAAQGEQLQVAVDGRLIRFHQDGGLVTVVAIPPTWERPSAIGYNEGTAGIIFAAEDNRGQIGGQRADNLVVSRFRPLQQQTQALPENFDVETLMRRIPANQAWIQTGLTLEAGNTVEITASGTVDAAPRAGQRAFYHEVPPEGRSERFDYLPQPHLPALALMGRIGNGPAFAVGKSLRIEVGKEQGNGELWLGINDDVVNDNTGEWLVEITRDVAAANSAP